MRLRRKLCPCCEPLPTSEPELMELMERLGLPRAALYYGPGIFDAVEVQKRIREACASRRAARTWLVALVSMLVALISALAAVFSALAAWYAIASKTSQ